MARNGSTWLVVFAILGLYSWDLSLRSSAGADPQPKRNPHERTRIALADMAHVFKASKDFNRKQEALKSRIAEQEDISKSKHKVLFELMEKYKRLDPSSERARDLEIQMEKLKTDFEEFRTRMQNEFLKQEVQMYFETYKTITEVIADYAQAHEIDLVIRWNCDPLTGKEDPKQFMDSMNRQVLYDNGLDITEAIIAAVNIR